MSKPKPAIKVSHESAPGRRQRIHVQWTEKRRLFFDRKYLIELYVGRVLLFACSPLILFLWILVRLTSRGRGFYRQTRIGLNGQEFELFKLRTMRNDAEIGGQAVWCRKGDIRITWLGKILRTLHLDELPQLLNVARGEMSLVGPRPERPMICKKLENEVEGYFDRVIVKPGITGLSQINLPPDTCLADVRRKQVLDLQYINETNLLFESRILFATALRIVGIKGELTMKWMFLCRRSLLREMGLAPQSKKQLRPQTKPHSSFSIPVNQESLQGVASDSDGKIDLDCDSVDSPSAIGLPS